MINKTDILRKSSIESVYFHHIENSACDYAGLPGLIEADLDLRAWMLNNPGRW